MRIQGSQPSLAARAVGQFNLYERGLCRVISRTGRRVAVRHFFAATSRLGDGVAWYVLMGMLAMTQGSAGQAAAIQMALTGAVGLMVYKLLKSRLLRERPFVSWSDIPCGTPPLDRYSFPSGHTLHAVLFTTVCLAWFPALAAILIPFALLIAVSRVVLGLHYPTDVLVGALIGWGLARLSLALVAPLPL